MKRKLGTSVNTSLRVKQKITLVKYAIAGTVIFTLLGISTFMYLNFANSEQAAAGNGDTAKVKTAQNESFIDLSYLTSEEMDLLLNRDFVRDTIQKEYTSVKWDISALTHLTLEVSNKPDEYSLELFDPAAFRVLYLANLTSDKVLISKQELIPNIEYSYLVRNTIGEMYAGKLKF